MKKLYVQLLALLLTFGFATGAAAYDKQKAAYHVNYYDAKRQTGALSEGLRDDDYQRHW